MGPYDAGDSAEPLHPKHLITGGLKKRFEHKSRISISQQGFRLSLKVPVERAAVTSLLRRRRIGKRLRQTDTGAVSRFARRDAEHMTRETVSRQQLPILTDLAWPVVC